MLGLHAIAASVPPGVAGEEELEHRKIFASVSLQSTLLESDFLLKSLTSLLSLRSHHRVHPTKIPEFRTQDLVDSREPQHSKRDRVFPRPVAKRNIEEHSSEEKNGSKLWGQVTNPYTTP